MTDDKINPKYTVRVTTTQMKTKTKMLKETAMMMMTPKTKMIMRKMSIGPS